MAVYDILPKTNLKQEDIRDTLNAYGASVGEYGPEYFSEDANLNMWSRYKPLRISADFINLFDDDRWKGTDGQCGINFSDKLQKRYRQGKCGQQQWLDIRLAIGRRFLPVKDGRFQGVLSKREASGVRVQRTCPCCRRWHAQRADNV